MITVATYNILHGHHIRLILENIALLVEQNADVVCLQEAAPTFEKQLAAFLESPKMQSWKMHCVHVGSGGSLAILWDSSRVAARGFETVSLPRLSRPILIERLKGRNEMYQRAAIMGQFDALGYRFNITNVHLAWEGGIRHRLTQLSHLTNMLPAHEDGNGIAGSILAGDFNTFALPRALKRQQERIGEVLGPRWQDALPELSWNFDISYTAPQNNSEAIVKICRSLGMKMRARMDYIFVKNLAVISSEMLDLPGSDHRPLLARFEI